MTNRCNRCGNKHSKECRYTDKNQCGGCRRFHFGRCYQSREKRHRREEECKTSQVYAGSLPPQFTKTTRVAPPQQTTASPAMMSNAIPLPAVPRRENKSPTMKKYCFIGMGKNCPAVTPTKITKDYWRDNYNRVLQGTGIHIERVEVNPRLPRE